MRPEDSRAVSRAAATAYRNDPQESFEEGELQSCQVKNDESNAT